MMYPEIQPGGRLGRLVFLPRAVQFRDQGAVPGNVFGGGGVGVLEQGHHQVYGFPVEMCMAKVITTVDGGNPAPPGMYKTM